MTVKVAVLHIKKEKKIWTAVVVFSAWRSLRTKGESRALRLKTKDLTEENLSWQNSQTENSLEKPYYLAQIIKKEKPFIGTRWKADRK